MRGFVAALLMTAGAVGAYAGEIAKDNPYYPLQLGNTWHYAASNGRELTLRVGGYEKVGQVLCARLDTIDETGKVVATEDIAATQSCIMRYAYGPTAAQPPVCFFHLPPRPGESWPVDSSVGTTRMHGTITAGSEKVTVPAGAFDTITTTAVFYQGDNPEPITTTLYFAKGVGYVRQTLDIKDVHVEIQLKSYEFGTKATR